MILEGFQKITLPDEPGVYLFKGKKGEILYIGKATSIRSRVRSYWSRDLEEARGSHIVDMVERAAGVEAIETESVLEALILESLLIKKHQPPFNTLAKDDKSFNHVVITDEAWPRVLLVRGKDLESNLQPTTHNQQQKTLMLEAKSYKLKAVYGPFPHGRELKEALRIIRRIFPFYDTPLPVNEMQSSMQRGKLRFNQEIGKYPGADATQEEYARTIRHIRLFFEGKKKAAIRELEREMKAYAKEQEFERAEEMKRRIFALTHIQDISLIKRDKIEALAESARGAFRIEAYDIAHQSGKNMGGVMVVVEDGEAKKSDYRLFKIRSVKSSNDPAALREVILRRFGHSEWPYPNLIVVDGGAAQVNAANYALRELGLAIEVVGVVKDVHHRPKEVKGRHETVFKREREILLANSEAHRFAISYHKRMRGRAFGA